MADYHSNALAEVLRRLAATPSLPVVVARIAGSATALGADLQQTVLGEVPEFSKSRNPDLLPEMTRHGQEHVREIIRLLRHGSLGTLEFVHEHARRRAEQRFPLEATLHAYRSGHKVFVRWLREAALAAASSAEEFQLALPAIVDFAIEYTDAISTAFAGTYSSHAVLLADVAGDLRSQLLAILLDGRDESDAHAERLLRDAGFLEERQWYCVALARSVDALEMLDPSRARRLAEAMDHAVASLGLRHVIDVHANKVVLVAGALRRDSGWTAPRASLVGRLRDALALVGNAALIGLSKDAPSTAHIPTAYREAAAALEIATAAERIVLFESVPLQRLLLHFGGDALRRVLPAWAAELEMADRRSDGVLATTLRVYAAADMNVLKAAAALGLHPNTVYARLQRIADCTGREPRSFRGLTELLVVCDCHERATA